AQTSSACFEAFLARWLGWAGGFPSGRLFLSDGLIQVQQDPGYDGVGGELGRGYTGRQVMGGLVFAGGDFVGVNPTLRQAPVLFFQQRKQLRLFLRVGRARKGSAKGVGHSVAIGFTAMLERVARQCLGTLNEHGLVERYQRLEGGIGTHAPDAGEISVRSVEYLQSREGGRTPAEGVKSAPIAVRPGFFFPGKRRVAGGG